jgi:hypothetical protein
LPLLPRQHRPGFALEVDVGAPLTSTVAREVGNQVVQFGAAAPSQTDITRRG